MDNKTFLFFEVHDDVAINSTNADNIPVHHCRSLCDEAL
jgi:hypothetical protein